MSKKVLIVDDHPLICHAIRQALVPIGFESAGETADGADAVRMIESLKPDIVILDIGLEKLDGLTVLKRIRRDKLDTRVLVYTSQAKENYASRCLQAGASGFVSKNEPIGKLVKAVETIADGYIFFPKDAMPLLGSVETTGDIEDLTDRELQIFKLLAEGVTNSDIASRLSLSNKTVSGHKINIQSKLGVTSVIELADIARRHNFI
ncbi:MULTISPECIES: response regulator transcription factor [Pseudomonas]|uniref:Response regulator transcription factor n=1 Tax=Pseudomonas monsensis TaxID=2745509 RepID=A0ABT3YUT0_9PSED|nr:MULTISPECIES: response regulator transcription factor [Pseudomonas]MCY0109263.1 response regulator transcription factor [Pseudomonas monsensis]PTS95150.1 DNA-binding response regulator [Pseudomonas sp. HMWF006]PTT71631.1 DNA-binding response regulator [Pseudomonas sp. HMWF007]PTT89936.1 DNA-binding response regulator [Pseudomonas sp. HMWF005]